MPTTINITCDNPNCPGNQLDPASEEGWIKMNTQVSLPNEIAFQQSVYCSPSCASSVGTALEEAAAARES